MKVTLFVPPDLAAEVQSWEDGADYIFEVTQRQPGIFDVNDAYSADEYAEKHGAEEQPGDEANSGAGQASESPFPPPPEPPAGRGKRGAPMARKPGAAIAILFGKK
jgi:hypothetical protein